MNENDYLKIHLDFSQRAMISVLLLNRNYYAVIHIEFIDDRIIFNRDNTHGLVWSCLCHQWFKKYTDGTWLNFPVLDRYHLPAAANLLWNKLLWRCYC